MWWIKLSCGYYFELVCFDSDSPVSVENSDSQMDLNQEPPRHQVLVIKNRRKSEHCLFFKLLKKQPVISRANLGGVNTNYTNQAEVAVGQERIRQQVLV